MSRKGTLAPEFAVPLMRRLHRTLAMESVWCFGTSLLLVCVFRWTPSFRRFWPGLVFGCTTLPPMQLSKFFWAVKTFEGPISVDAFCRLYEMHPQTRKVSFDEDPQVYSAQSGCSFHPRRTNKTHGIDRMELSYCQKNKWEDDWEQYWFYAKIGFPSVDSSE